MRGHDDRLFELPLACLSLEALLSPLTKCIISQPRLSEGAPRHPPAPESAINRGRNPNGPFEELPLFGGPNAFRWTVLDDLLQPKSWFLRF